MAEERLTRTEMHCMQWMMHAISMLKYTEKDLARRLETIPDGTERLKQFNADMDELFRDICKTIPEKQRRHLLGVAKDYEARLVPRLMPESISVVLTREEAMDLVDAAQIKCHWDCVPDLDESRSCKLCKILESVVPLESYNSISCPYWRAEWEDK